MATEFPMLDFKVGVEGTDKVEGLQVIRNDLLRLCKSRD